MRDSTGAARISIEMLHHQGTWAAGFLLVVLAGKLVLGVATGNGLDIGNGLADEDFFTIVYRSTKGFMLVIGIISAVGFIGHYVRNGFTRTAYFRGASLAALALSLAFPLVVGAIAPVLGLIDAVDPSDSPILAEFDGSWGMALATYGVQIFVFYLMGWIIGAGFYRYDVMRGIGFIAVAAVLVSCMDVLWQFELASLWGGMLSTASVSANVPIPLSFAGSLAVMAVAIAIIRLLTRNVAIKMK